MSATALRFSLAVAVALAVSDVPTHAESPVPDVTFTVYTDYV